VGARACMCKLEADRVAAAAAPYRIDGSSEVDPH